MTAEICKFTDFKYIYVQKHSPGDAADGENVPRHLRGLYKKFRNIIKSAADQF